MTVIALIGSYGKQEIYQNLILQAAYFTMELLKSRSKHIQGQMRTLTSKLYLMSARLALDLSLLLFPQALLLQLDRGTVPTKTGEHGS